jgi:hypothetical protein
MVQKSYSEGMRALVLYTATIQDAFAIGEAEGLDKDKLQDLHALNDLLLPIVKGYGSEKSWVLLGTESLQTFGGAGFTEDWPLEQYVRDAKIDTLYEGTTAIQGMDFFFRKIVRDGGRSITLLGKEIGKYASGGGNLADEKKQLLRALEDVQGMITHMIGVAMESVDDPKQIYKVGLNTSRLLMATGELIIAWLLIQQADIAQTKLANPGRDKDFYDGKIASAKFFVRSVLPRIAVERAVVESETGEIMEISESAF